MAKPSNPDATITSAEHNGHYLSFYESPKLHKYTFDGFNVPGCSTFPKGGYPASEGLTSWMIGRAADAAVRLGWKEYEDTRDNVFGTPPISEDRIEELVKEAKKKPDEEADAAGDVGTILHSYAYLTEVGKSGEALSLLRTNKGHPDFERIKLCVDQFDAWYKQDGYADTVVAAEAIVALPCSHHWTEADKADTKVRLNIANSPYCLCFAGKFDRLVQRGSRLILSDFKTASGIYHDTPMQLVAYKMAVEYWLGGEIDGIEILNFSKKTGKFTTVLMDDKAELRDMEAQVMRCRETFAFKRHWSADKRFSYTPKAKEK